MISRALFFVAMTGLVAACSDDAAQGPRASAGPAAVVQATDASCRPTRPGRRMTLCSVTLTASATDALIAVESPRAARAALQDVPIENGMVVVTPRSGPLGLPAGQAVRLASGSTAIALQGVSEPITAGQGVPLTLTFNLAPPVEIVAPVADEPAT